MLPRRVGVLIAAFELISMAVGVALSPVFGLDDGGNYATIGIGKGLVVLAIALSLRGRVRGPHVGGGWARPHVAPTRSFG